MWGAGLTYTNDGWNKSKIKLGKKRINEWKKGRKYGDNFVTKVSKERFLFKPFKRNVYLS